MVMLAWIGIEFHAIFFPINVIWRKHSPILIVKSTTINPFKRSSIFNPLPSNPNNMNATLIMQDITYKGHFFGRMN